MIEVRQALPPSLVPTTPFTEQHTFLLAVGITVVLALASAIGVGLKITVAKRQPHGTIDNLNTRVNAWWAMSIVVGLALLTGQIGVTLLFAFASFVALREFVAPAQGRHGERALLLTCFCVVLPLQFRVAVGDLDERPGPRAGKVGTFDDLERFVEAILLG